jgi:osmotically-inducible protein OsmY
LLLVALGIEGGKVVLEGTVPEHPMKHGIEELVDVAPGVQEVDNRIRVQGS